MRSRNPLTKKNGKKRVQTFRGLRETVRVAYVLGRTENGPSEEITQILAMGNQHLTNTKTDILPHS
jgi:hypothetical protein